MELWSLRLHVYESNLHISGGGETLPILKIERFGSDYRLGFAKGYALALLNIKPRTMTWRSLASGDTFSCKRHKR
jgi:hypothetical protein